MKLATTTGDFSRNVTTPEEAIKYIAEAGFKNIDYSFILDYENQTGIFSENPEAHIKKVIELANSLGVKFVQAHAPMGTPIIYDEEQRQFIEDTKKCIIACKELGIDRIVVHTGYRKGLSKEETFIENKKFFDELLGVAEACGVNVLAENFNRMCVDGLYWIDNAKDLAEFIKYVNHPLLHACWDAGHGNMLPTPQREALKILGDEVYALHVQDNMGDDDTHHAPLLGTMDVDSLMQGLKEIGYKGYFTFEGKIFAGMYQRKQEKLFPTLSLNREAEKLLYQIGKFILSAYGEYEE